MAIAGSLTYITEIDKSGFEKGLNSLQSISSVASKAIKMALGGIITAITGIGTYAIKVGSEFEAGMSKVQAISGATGKEIEKLTEKAKEMGQKTKFSATESAEAFQYMAMAGWKTEDMLNGIEGIMNLAAASGEDLASVSDIVTDALTAFGLQAKDSAHFADVLAKASSNSNTNVGLMGETFKYVAPLAGSMKYSVEDTAVAIGLMANAGIKGSQAGTALRSMLTRLVKPPKEAAQALTALNVSAKNSDGTMKPLSQTLQELRKKFSKLSDSQKSSYAASIAGQEAMSGMLAIVNASDSDFEKLTASINNANGASKEMADTMNDNVKGALTLLKSNIESVGIKIYDKIKEPLKKLINEISKYVSKIPTLLKNVYNWVNKNKEAIKKVVIVITSLTAGYVAYQKVLMAIKAINMVKGFLNLLNPIGLATAGIVALTTAFVGLQVAHFNEITSLNGLKNEVENQKRAWEDLQATRQNALNSSMTEIGICENLKNELMQISDENGKVKTGYEDRAKVILNTLNGALGTEYQLNGNIIEQYQDLKNNIGEVIAKKKAEAVLTAYQEEYGVAVREQSKATETLIGLKQQQIETSKKLATGTYEERIEAQQTLSVLGDKIKEQTDLIGSYGKTIQDYENLQKATAEGSSEAITSAIDEIGISYETTKIKVGESVIEQINAQQKYVDSLRSSLDVAKKNHDTYQEQILQKQLTTNEEQLNNLKSSLKNQTNTVKELSPEQVEAWKETANRSVVEYSQLLAQVPEETQKEIEKATGIVGQDIGLYNACGTTATNATVMFRDNLQLDSMANNEIQKASTEINNDTSVNLASLKLAKDANEGFNNNVNGLKWGSDLGANIANGLKSKKSIGEVAASAAAVAGCISDYLHHTVPEKGPLQNDDKWMFDMMDNFAKGIDKGLPRVINKTKKVAEDIKNSFEIQKINEEIYRKMQNAVARENASITAKATLEANNSMLNVIQANFNIDGSIDIDGQKAGRILAPNITKTIKAGGLV